MSSLRICPTLKAAAAVGPAVADGSTTSPCTTGAGTEGVREVLMRQSVSHQGLTWERSGSSVIRAGIRACHVYNPRRKLPMTDKTPAIRDEAEHFAAVRAGLDLEASLTATDN